MAWSKPLDATQRRAYEEWLRNNPQDAPRYSSGQAHVNSKAMVPGDSIRKQSDRIRSIDYSKVGNQATPEVAKRVGTPTQTGGPTRVTRLDKLNPAPSEPSRVRRAIDWAKDKTKRAPKTSATQAATQAVTEATEEAAKKAATPKGGILRTAGKIAKAPFKLAGAAARAPFNPYTMGATALVTPSNISESSFVQPGERMPEPTEGFSYETPMSAPGNMRYARNYDGMSGPPPRREIDSAMRNNEISKPKHKYASDTYRYMRDPRHITDPDRLVAEAEPSRQFPGAWDSGVPGIGARPGTSGEPEFFDEGGFKKPMRKGEINVLPANAFVQSGALDNSSAIRAAAASGDWDALERVGAIRQRGPVGTSGGGGYGQQGTFDPNEALKRADQLYSLADSSRDPRQRSRYLKQARAMMSFAENVNDNATRMYGLDAAMSRAAMGAQGESDPTKDILNLANARKANAEAVATELGMGKLSAQELTALGTLGGAAGEQLLNSMAQDETLRHHMGRIGGYFDDVGRDPSKFLEAYEKGLMKGDKAFDKSLANYIKMMKLSLGIKDEEPSMGDWIREQFGLAEGGYVPDVSAMAGYGMEDAMGPMGAMDMAGEGFGMPDPLMIEYTQYAKGAEKLGVSAIPFEEFAQMKQMSVPQAPEAPGMEQPYSAMGFAAGGQVPPRNQFGYKVDPNTGRTPVGQAGWSRHFDRENFPRPQRTVQPQQAQRPVQFQQGANPSSGYGPLAQSYGLNRQMVQNVRDQAQASGGIASYGDRMPSLMDTYGMGGSRFGGNNVGFNAGGMVPPFMDRRSAIGFAKGGGVPVGGKMVVDPDPNAPTDSIPAMIDGQQPAALDSGEFVIPRHAVMFHGVDKLNKLIAQAEKEPG